MNASRWFVTSDGQLRAPWRILLFVAACAACGVVAQLFITPAISTLYLWAGVRVSADGWTAVAALLGGHYIALRVVDRRPWEYVALDRIAARPTLLARGFLLGASGVGLPILVLVGTHWMSRVYSVNGSWTAAAARVSLSLLPAAFSEELLSRGYIFAVLRHSWGVSGALVATSVGFGLLHLQNAGVSLESLMLVMLAGVFLGAVLIATRSLYAAWMAHFAWNWTMAVLFHTAVSGIRFESPDYRFVDTGPDWATGGSWGPEGGAAAGLGMLASIAYLYARHSPRRRARS